MSKKSSTQNIKAIDCSQKAAKLKDSEVFESWVLNRPKMSGPYYSWKVDIALKVGRLAAFSTAKAQMKLKKLKKEQNIWSHRQPIWDFYFCASKPHYSFLSFVKANSSYVLFSCLQSGPHYEREEPTS